MRCLFVLGLAACGFSAHGGGGTVDGAPDSPMIDAPRIDGPPGTARKKPITIPAAKVFADLTAFPVWFVINDADLQAKAAAAGTDIYFTKPDGTPLEYERVAWDKASGHLEAWIKLDLLDAAGAQFDLRYGDAGPWHAPNAPAVYTNAFQAVWHMDAMSGTTIADARGAVNGTAMNGPTMASGKLAKGIDLDGNNDEVTFTNPITGNNSSTISAWISVSTPTMGFSSVMTVGDPATNSSRFLHTMYMGGLSYGFYGNDIGTNNNVHIGSFTLLHWVYDGAAKTASLYRDGAQVGTTATISGTINTTGTGGHIGNAPMNWGPGGNTLNPINGVMDEVRIASAPRSLGWIQTEFANQNDPATFFMIGQDGPAQ